MNDFYGMIIIIAICLIVPFLLGYHFGCNKGRRDQIERQKRRRYADEQTRDTES